jgi:F0F1-type ATP synthase delta subunit
MFGIDVLSAQALKKREAEELTEKINKKMGE